MQEGRGWAGITVLGSGRKRSGGEDVDVDLRGDEGGLNELDRWMIRREKTRGGENHKDNKYTVFM